MIDPQPQPAVPEPEPYPFWGYRDVLVLIGLAFVLLIFVGTVARFLSTSPRLSAAQALAVTFAFEALWTATLYGVIRGGYGRPFWSSLGWVHPKEGFWKCVGAGLLAAACTIVIGSLMPRPNVKMPMEELLRDRGSILLLGVFAITLGPLFEELAFRGFLMPLLMRTFGPIPGIALQAAPFAILHGAEYAWAWQQLVLMFLAGAAFGWMRYKTGSIAASTYMHAGYNLVALTGIFAQSFVK